MDNQLNIALLESINENYSSMNIHKYMQLSEVEKINISRNLIDKIYVNIAEKYNTIDFETIPASNGKIIKMKEYANLKESIELMKSIAKDSKQTIPEIDVLNTAITNIERFQDIFYMGFVNKNASVILMYNILTLSVYCGTSLMISVLVDYINMGNTDTVQLIINKKYNKKGSYLLIESLKKFNETVKNGSFMKMIDASYNKNDQLNESVTFTVLTIVAAIVAVFAIVPLTKELIFLFYYTRMRLSEAAELQAKLIDANIDTIKTTGVATPNMIRIQEYFRDKLVWLSHLFAFEYEKGEKKAQLESRTKLTSKDVVLF